MATPLVVVNRSGLIDGGDLRERPDPNSELWGGGENGLVVLTWKEAIQRCQLTAKGVGVRGSKIC